MLKQEYFWRMGLTLLVLKWTIESIPCSYWCPESLHRQVINIHGFIIQDKPVFVFHEQKIQLPIPWLRHQMETFSALPSLCAGNLPVTGEFPHKGQWHGALMFCLICAWMNGWVNNRESSDLRRHRVHYEVTLMPSLGWEMTEKNLLFSEIIWHTFSTARLN